MKRILTLVLAVLLTASLLVSCQGAKTAKDFTIIEENFGEEFYGIGFRKGDNALTLKVQETIDAMIADGKFAEISNKWFGKDVAVANAAFPRAIEEVEGDTSLEYILDKGELILGLDETFPPMGYRDANGDIVGFDIDLATEVCARLGIKLKLQPIDWNSKEMELSTKSIDCIWNGMSITDERVENMNISKPYIANRQVVVTANDSGIAVKADLNGKKVATQAGSAALEAINAEAEAAGSADAFGKVTEYASFDDAWLDLKAGTVDALVIDEVYIRYVMENDK
ncbi:MAG: transporter substrate-binding domain-containing protein [Oscillospiraceae bacterium]|nr:transporter substrate-binding domain-containing protein [Oscillospiraceae bacterium]